MVSVSIDLYRGNHRNQRRLLLVGSLVILLVAIAPRHERALFVTPIGAKALAAIVQPPAATNIPALVLDEPRPGAFVARVPRGAPRPPAGFGAVPDAPAAPPSQPGFTTLPGTGDSAGGAPGSFTRLAQGPLGSGFPFGPAGLTPGQSSPAAPSDSSGGSSSTGGSSTSTGGTTSTGGGTTTSSSGGEVIPAVPEPATWLTMMMGTFALGAMLRRRRNGARVHSAVTLAPDTAEANPHNR